MLITEITLVLKISVLQTFSDTWKVRDEYSTINLCPFLLLFWGDERAAKKHFPMKVTEFVTKEAKKITFLWGSEPFLKVLKSEKKAILGILLFSQVLTNAPLLHLCMVPTPYVITLQALIAVPAKLDFLEMNNLVNVRMFGLWGKGTSV